MQKRKALSYVPDSIKFGILGLFAAAAGYELIFNQHPQAQANVEFQQTYTPAEQ